MKKILKNKYGQLFGCLIIFIAIVIIWFFAMKYIVKHLNASEIIVGVILFLVIIAIFDFRKRRTKRKAYSIFLDVAQHIRPAFQKELESFFNLYYTDKKKFIAQERISSSDYKNLTSLDLFSMFMESKKQIINIDWHGEENESEIQEFIKSLNQKTISWIKTDELRKSREKKKIADNKFITKLLKSIDEDTQSINSRLLFLKTDGDNYVFTTVDSENYKKVVSKLPKEFYGAEKL